MIFITISKAIINMNYKKNFITIHQNLDLAMIAKYFKLQLFVDLNID